MWRVRCTRSPSDERVVDDAACGERRSGQDTARVGHSICGERRCGSDRSVDFVVFYTQAVSRPGGRTPVSLPSRLPSRARTPVTSRPSRLPSFARAQYIPSRARASHIPSRARAPHISTSLFVRTVCPLPTLTTTSVPPFRLGLVLRVELDDHLLGCRTGTLPLARLGRSLRCHRRRRCRLGSRS